MQSAFLHFIPQLERIKVEYIVRRFEFYNRLRVNVGKKKCQELKCEDAFLMLIN